MQPDHPGSVYPTEIEGATFFICTEVEYDELGDRCLSNWRAWSFFAYDHTRNIFPADAVPEGVKVQESIASGWGATEIEARQVVEDRLRRVIQTKNLEGTGFYSPPAGKIYPQEFPESD